MGDLSLDNLEKIKTCFFLFCLNLYNKHQFIKPLVKAQRLKQRLKILTLSDNTKTNIKKKIIKNNFSLKLV